MGLSTKLSVLLAVCLSPLVTVAGPAAGAQTGAQAVARQAPNWWFSSIQRQGRSVFGADPTGYKVFRNVKDYGAKGDGSTDDTVAINQAISDGQRCGQNCPSQTTTPAIIYFPPGTYMVSQPIIQFYYTQIIGDAVNLPVIKATAGFKGMAVIDADPYDKSGNNWWINQNNFFRQVRNLEIDLTGMSMGTGAGIHWQVAQATSLQNMVFRMSEDQSEGNKQIGIFMDNGSGGFMSDLKFIGGQYGAFFGSQQFTTRNMTFQNCQTAVFMNWNWGWALKDIHVSGGKVAVDMSNGGASQTVGSVMVTDSTFENVGVGIKTAYSLESPQTNGTLIMDNVDMTNNVPVAVSNQLTSSTVLTGNQKIASWVQGKVYATANNGRAVQTVQTTTDKPTSLLDGAGRVFTRSKPQYESVPASSFVSVKSAGAAGDGVTDDTVAIQKVLNSATADQVVYFDHGAYLVTDTVKVPKNIKIVGEAWPLILAGGKTNFANQNKPKAVFQVGQVGEKGSVEMSDLLFLTQGPQPGAIMIQWNVAEAKQGSVAMWDVHVRVGGSAGTNLQMDKCAKAPQSGHEPQEDCMGAFLMLHVAPQSSVYLENTWFWVADHDMEPAANNSQIDVYSGRGVLIETDGPVWAWGTASEHSVLYNYQIVNSSAVYMSMIQSETPYMQGNPDATKPFAVNAAYHDPDFNTCSDAACKKAWGVRAVNSKNVFIFGAGLYSFFDNYDQTCLKTQSCQSNMFAIEQSDVHLYGLSTKAATNMLTINGQSGAVDSDNRNNFCATLAFFSSSSSAPVGNSDESAERKEAMTQPMSQPMSQPGLDGEGRKCRVRRRIVE